jgi:hypothetical protein
MSDNTNDEVSLSSVARQQDTNQNTAPEDGLLESLKLFFNGHFEKVNGRIDKHFEENEKKIKQLTSSIERMQMDLVKLEEQSAAMEIRHNARDFSVYGTAGQTNSSRSYSMTSNATAADRSKLRPRRSFL